MDITTIMESLSAAKKLIDNHRIQFASVNSAVWLYLDKVGEHITKAQKQQLNAFLTDFEGSAE